MSIIQYVRNWLKGKPELPEDNGWYFVKAEKVDATEWEITLRHKEHEIKFIGSGTSWHELPNFTKVRNYEFTKMLINVWERERYRKKHGSDNINDDRVWYPGG